MLLQGICEVEKRPSVGSRVRVSEHYAKEDLRGSSGTVMALYGHGNRTAVHVRFTDGLWQLLWAEDLERLLECIGRSQRVVGRRG